MEQLLITLKFLQNLWLFSRTIVFFECFCDASPDFFVMVYCEVVFFFDWSAEGVFHGIAEWHIHSLVNVEPGCAFSPELHGEIALIVIKMRDFFPK